MRASGTTPYCLDLCSYTIAGDGTTYYSSSFAVTGYVVSGSCAGTGLATSAGVTTARPLKPVLHTTR